MWSLWSKWLPKEAETTVRRGGYYTLRLREGQRIVALNSMDCYLYNWWIFYNGSIVLEQLQWFHDTLLAAEKAGERVQVLTHIPSGDADCWSEWSREYNRIVARFSRVITGIYNGHTHKDEMNVHYTDTGLAMAVSWNGGSLTTYSYKNPNYRLYELHSKTLQVLEHHTYTINLTEANLKPNESPSWKKEYEFGEQFTRNTSAAGIDQLLEDMAKKPDLLRRFWRYKMTEADPKLETGCDDSCLSRTICRIATSNYNEKQRCRELQAILKESVSRPGLASFIAFTNCFFLSSSVSAGEGEAATGRWCSCINGLQLHQLAGPADCVALLALIAIEQAITRGLIFAGC